MMKINEHIPLENLSNTWRELRMNSASNKKWDSARKSLIKNYMHINMFVIPMFAIILFFTHRYGMYFLCVIYLIFLFMYTYYLNNGYKIIKDGAVYRAKIIKKRTIVDPFTSRYTFLFYDENQKEKLISFSAGSHYQLYDSVDIYYHPQLNAATTVAPSKTLLR